MSSSHLDVSPTVRLNGASFSDARRALADTARVGVVGCVGLAQRMVRQQLRAQHASEDLVRIAGSDLVETLLARAALPISATMSGLARERHTTLTAYLCAVLVRWLQARTEHDHDQQALVRAGAALHR